MSFAIETTNLTRRFAAVTAVAGLNLAVPAGSIFGFLGPNGAGKTTTIRMLAGLLEPSGGEILFEGRNIRSALYEYLSLIHI